MDHIKGKKSQCFYPNQTAGRFLSTGYAPAKRPSAQVLRKGGLIMGQTKYNMAAENLAANRNYKSTVFAMLFGDRERFLNINWNHNRKRMEAKSFLETPGV